MKYEALIRDYLKKTYKNYEISDVLPEWIEKENWKPAFYLTSSGDNRVLAVDILLSGSIRHYQYSILKRLLAENSNFRIITITLDERFEENPELKDFIEARGIGLKIIEPGRGLKTIRRIDIDTEVIEIEFPVEDGWFPSSILDKARLKTSEFCLGFLL